MFKTFGLVGMKDKRILATRKIVEKDFFIKRIIAHAKTALQEPKPEPVEAAKKIQVAAPIQSMQLQPMRQAVLL